MARSLRVITFDNRGTGRSEKPDGPITVAQMADDAIGLLGSLGIARAHVMGVSMGGYIAQEIALRQLDAVDRLVLGCTHCGPPIRIAVPRELLAPVMTPAAANDPAQAMRDMWPTWYPAEFVAASREFLEAQIDRSLTYPTPLATRRKQLDAITEWSSHQRLHHLTVQTLVLTGDRDALVLPENARILQERIAGSRLHVISGAGHIFWHSHVDETVSVVSDFLTQRE
jgi:3-oxoadipate enol-lactonase